MSNALAVLEHELRATRHISSGSGLLVHRVFAWSGRKRFG